MKLNMSDNGESKKKQGLSDKEMVVFAGVRRSFRNPFADVDLSPNIPKSKGILESPHQDEALYSKIPSNTVQLIRKNESVTDVLGKLYNLLSAVLEDTKLRSEISHDFDKEKSEKLKDRHDEIIEAFGSGGSSSGVGSSNSSSGKKKYTKVKKKKKLGFSMPSMPDWLATPVALLEMSAALLVLDQLAGPGDITTKIGALGQTIADGISGAWDIAKVKIDKLKPFAPSILEIFTTPIMNWLHDKLSSVFGEDTVNRVFEKKTEVDIKALGQRLVDSMFGEDEITKDTKSITESLTIDRFKEPSKPYEPLQKIESTEDARSSAEKYLGRKMSDQEYTYLIRATTAESSTNKEEYGMVMGSILNRAKKQGGDNSIIDVLQAKNQFQSVTGTSKNDHKPSAVFMKGPTEKQLQLINQAAVTVLPKVSHEQKDFSAASAAAYGEGTNIAWRDKVAAQGGVVGQSVFNTKLMDQPLYQPDITPTQPTQIPSSDIMLSAKSKENIDLKKEQSVTSPIIVKTDNNTTVMNHTTKQNNIINNTKPYESPFLSSIGVS